MPTTEPQRYDAVSMFLHWSIALGIVLVAGLELARGEFPKGSFIREGLKAIHQPAGVVLFGLILARITWRFAGAKVPPAHGRGLMDFAGHVAHIALYLMMVLLPLLGIVYVFGSDRVIDFGAFKLAMPMKATLGWLARPAREIHEALGVTILIVAGIHAAAAIFHHRVLGDDVLKRMMPGRGADARVVAAG